MSCQAAKIRKIDCPMIKAKVTSESRIYVYAKIFLETMANPLCVK